MPTISVLYGIVIRMYFNDHAPPHFHARYGEFEATISWDEAQRAGLWKETRLFAY